METPAAADPIALPAPTVANWANRAAHAPGRQVPQAGLKIAMQRHNLTQMAQALCAQRAKCGDRLYPWRNVNGAARHDIGPREP
jgi:hypothetical protein